MANNTWIWLAAGAAGLYFLSKQNATPVTDTGGGTVEPINTGLLDTSTVSVPTTYGLNPYNAKSPTNYTALVAANPNLANPNYQLTDAEKAQYLANYADLRRGETMNSAQAHWTAYGCNEGRIFLPMSPPSTF